METKRIAIISNPKAGKSSLISELVELQNDILSLGIYPIDCVGHVFKKNPQVVTIRIKNIDIELVELSTNVSSIPKDVDGLIVLISCMDMFGNDSYQLWNWAISTGLPCIAFISKIDLAIHAPKYLNSIQGILKHTKSINQNYMCAEKNKKYIKIKQRPDADSTISYPLIFGSSKTKIGVLDLMKTIAQYMVLSHKNQ